MNIQKHIHRPFVLPAFLALTGLFFTLPLQASHIIGGEIRYECLGNNQYRIILDVYRDCYYGIPPFDAPAHVGIYTESGLFVNNMNLQPVIDTIPNNIAGDPCLFVPGDVCVEHARYQGTITLSNSQGGYYFVYQRCCRNQTITNILDPEETGATYFVHLTQEARNVCNNSPKFDYSPPVFVCVNKPIMHPHAAVDAEGDSLVYSFYTPFHGASFNNPQPGIPPPPPYTNISWNTAGGYGLTTLLGNTPEPLTINSQTGLIKGLPQIMGQFVVGVMVEEYRNGVLLSRIRRDFQYNVGECGVIEATIVAPAAQCDNLTVHFENETDVTDNFIWYFNWPNLAPSSTLEEPFYTFPSVGTYTVALIAAPGTQCVDTSFHTIFLQNNSLNANFNLSIYECSNQSVLALQDLSTDNISPPVEWTWTVSYGNQTLTSNLQHPIFLVPNPSTGTVKLVVKSQNGCVQEKTLPFNAANGINPIEILPNQVNVCLGSSVQLNPNGPGSPFTYQWGPLVPANQQNAINPTVSPTVNTTYSVTISVNISGGGVLCQSTGTVQALVSPLPVLNFEVDTDCNGKVAHFVNQSLNVPAGYKWDFGDPGTTVDMSTLPNPTYVYPNYGTYTITLSTAAANVCQATTSKTVSISEKILQAAFDFNYTNCDEDAVTIQFFDESINNQNNTDEWEWEFSGAFNGSSGLQNPTITVTNEGTLNVTLTITTGENCVSTTPAAGSTILIDLPELPGVNDGGSVLGCINGGVTLNPGGNPNYIYKWLPATGLSCTDCPSPFANPSQTTTYTVNVQHLTADTCDFTKSITVTVPTNVGLVASNDVTTCNPTATLTASTVLSPVILTWTNEAGQQVGAGTSVSVPVSGYETYTVKAVDQFGCPYFDPVKVVGGPADISTNGDQIKCSNEDLNVFATNLDPNDTLTWQWSPASSFTGPTNVPNPEIIQTIGQQWVTVKAVNQFGCQKLDSTFVAIVDENAVLDFSSLVECSGSVVQFTNTSQNAYAYIWDFGDPTTNADTSTAENPTWVYTQDGTYDVTLDIIFDVSCVEPVTHPVTITEPVFTPDFTFEYVSCDEEFVEVQFHDATIANLLPPTIWNWTTSNGGISNLPNPIFIVQEGEEFEVTMEVEAANGCQGEVTKALKLEFIDVAFGDSMVLCKGDTAGINPFGNTGYAYNWSPNIYMDNPTSPNPQVSPPVTTTYTVEITNFSPDTCSITRSITVFVPEKIEVAADGDTLTCGLPVTLSGSSNITSTTFEWSAEPGGGVVGNEAVLEILPSTDQIFKVVGTDQYGCQDSMEIFVRNETVNTLLGGVSPECPDSEIPLTVTNTVPDHQLTFNWSATLPGQILPPGTGPTVTVLTAPAGESAAYTVIATNQYGCTQTHSQVISSYQFVPTVVSGLDVCPNVAEPLNPGSNPALTYQWSPATGLSSTTASNPMVNVSQSITYTVTVSNSFGSEACTEVLTLPVHAPPIIEITETVDTFTCGSAIDITAATNVATTVQWFDAQGNLLLTGNTLSVNPQAVETYFITATDNEACFEKDTVTVSNNQLDLALTSEGVIDTCPMTEYQICVTNLDPTDILTYDWSQTAGGQVLSGGTTACPTVHTDEGATQFFVEVENQWGCKLVDTVTVTTFTFNPVTRDVISICPGVATNINPEASGSNLIYAWSPATGLDNPNSPNPQATLFANQTYQVTIQGFNGDDICSTTKAVQVKVNPLIGLETSLPNPTSICEPVDVTMSAVSSTDNELTYIWSQNPNFSNPIGTTQQVTVTPAGTQTYFVQATDTLGCKDTAQLEINAYPIAVSLAPNFIFCDDSTAVPLEIELTNNDPAQILAYDWEPMSDIVEVKEGGRIIFVTPMETTVFSASIINQFGCEDTVSTTVSYYNIFPSVGQVTMSEDTILYLSNESIQFGFDVFDLAYKYQWEPATNLDDPSIFNPIFSPLDTGEFTFQVMVTNDSGCVTLRSVTVWVTNPECAPPNIFLPTGFSPNGDGENDVLYVRSNIIEELEFAIYNRWGQKVFETNDQSVGWDGTYKGQALTPDVYGLYLRAKCYNGEEYFKKGNVTLLR